MKLLAIDTAVEIDLPPLVTKLELVSPFVTTLISIENEGVDVKFELLPLEWLAELARFLTSDLYPPAEYRTNLTLGGDEFYCRLAGDCIELSVYDMVCRARRLLILTENDLITLVEAIYDQVEGEFRNRSSLDDPVRQHRAHTLAAILRWQERMSSGRAI